MKIDWFKTTIIIVIVLGVIGLSVLFGIPISEGLNKCNEMNLTGC